MSHWVSAKEYTSDRCKLDQEDEESEESSNSDTSSTTASEGDFSDVDSILSRTFDTSTDPALAKEDHGGNIIESGHIGVIMVTSDIYVEPLSPVEAISRVPGCYIGQYLPFGGAEASTTTEHCPLMIRPAVLSYKLVRAKLLNDREDLQLDVCFQDVVQVPSLKRLNDGSWEIMVEVSYAPDLPDLLRQVHQSFILHDDYEPLAPVEQDIQCFGRDRALTLSAVWFEERVKQSQKSERWIVATGYAHFYAQRQQEIADRIGITGVV